VKKTYLIILLLVSAGILRAQMNADPDAVTVTAATTTAATNAEPRVTHIDSDNANFDLNNRTATYQGHVVVTDPDMRLTCEHLVADLPQAGHIDRIVAETNVAIDFVQNNQATHVTGEKAVYSYKLENGTTNETVTLTGNPHVVSAQDNTTADVIIWDRANNGFRFINPHATIQSFRGITSTNAPATTKPLINTNPPAETNAPLIDTNQPVG